MDTKQQIANIENEIRGIKQNPEFIRLSKSSNPPRAARKFQTYTNQIRVLEMRKANLLSTNRHNPSDHAVNVHTRGPLPAQIPSMPYLPTSQPKLTSNNRTIRRPEQPSETYLKPQQPVQRIKPNSRSKVVKPMVAPRAMTRLEEKKMARRSITDADIKKSPRQTTQSTTDGLSTTPHKVNNRSGQRQPIPKLSNERKQSTTQQQVVQQQAAPEPVVDDDNFEDDLDDSEDI